MNSGSGRHADYATITIFYALHLCTALHPHTPLICALFTLPVLTRPFGIKTHPEREPCQCPMQTYINTFSHNRPQSRSFIMVLAQTQSPWRPCTPCFATQWKYKLIWWRCENAHAHTDCRRHECNTPLGLGKMLWVYIGDLT